MRKLFIKLVLWASRILDCKFYFTQYSPIRTEYITSLIKQRGYVLINRRDGEFYLKGFVLIEVVRYKKKNTTDKKVVAEQVAIEQVEQVKDGDVRHVFIRHDIHGNESKKGMEIRLPYYDFELFLQHFEKI